MIFIDFNLKHKRDTMTFCLDLFFVLSSLAFVWVGGGGAFSVWTGRF